MNAHEKTARYLWVIFESTLKFLNMEYTLNFYLFWKTSDNTRNILYYTNIKIDYFNKDPENIKMTAISLISVSKENVLTMKTFVKFITI